MFDSEVLIWLDQCQSSGLSQWGPPTPKIQHSNAKRDCLEYCSNLKGRGRGGARGDQARSIDCLDVEAGRKKLQSSGLELKRREGMSEGGADRRLRKITIPLKHLQPRGRSPIGWQQDSYMFSSVKQNMSGVSQLYQDVRRGKGRD